MKFLIFLVLSVSGFLAQAEDKNPCEHIKYAKCLSLTEDVNGAMTIRYPRVLFEGEYEYASFQEADDYDRSEHKKSATEFANKQKENLCALFQLGAPLKVESDRHFGGSNAKDLSLQNQDGKISAQVKRTGRYITKFTCKPK